MLDQIDKRAPGRPRQLLATRLAHKTTAKDPTNFADEECWYPVLSNIRSYGRTTTTARGVFEAAIGRKLGPPSLEQLEHTCRSFRVVDGFVTRCCNPGHQLLIINGTPVKQEFVQVEAAPPEPAPIVEPEAQDDEPPTPVFQIPEPTRQDEIEDLKDAFDAIAPAWRLDRGEMLTKFIGLYDEDIIREALDAYGVAA
jgi:hypothetical protein